MSKERKALDDFIKDYLFLCEKLCTNKQEKMLLDSNSPYNVLKTYLEAIDNSNPSEALNKLGELKYNIQDEIGYYYKGYTCRKEEVHKYDEDFKIIEQALLKAEKEHNSINLLMQELDCKDFADLRKYARCGYEKMNEKFIQ